MTGSLSLSTVDLIDSIDPIEQALSSSIEATIDSTSVDVLIDVLIDVPYCLYYTV
jgi:hypothetical protein